MKKLILSFVLLLAGLSVSAQDGGTSEWLTEFSEVSLSGPFAVTFVQVPETEAPVSSTTPKAPTLRNSRPRCGTAC